MHERKTINHIIALWREDKKHFVKRSTYSAYMLLVENHIIPEFGEMIDILEADIQRFVLKKLSDNLSQKTIKDILIVLKMILQFGVKYAYLEYQKIDIKFPTQTEQNDIEVLSRAHQKKIVSYIKENFTFKNLGIYICLSTGIRIGELCALTWDDIDTSTGIIKIRKSIQRVYIVDEDVRRTELILDTPKTKNSVRDIPITNELLKILKPIKKIVNSNFFVLTNEATPTEPRTYRNYFDKLLKELEIPKLKFHGLRHSFATRCIESNCDYKTVSVLLGHSNISTTLNLYVHPNLEQKKKCIERMSRFWDC